MQHYWNCPTCDGTQTVVESLVLCPSGPEEVHIIPCSICMYTILNSDESQRICFASLDEMLAYLGLYGSTRPYITNRLGNRKERFYEGYPSILFPRWPPTE